MAGARLCEDLLGMLHLELHGTETPTTYFAEESKLVANLQQSLVPLIFVIGDGKLGSLFTPEEVGDTLPDELIRNQANNDTDGQREETQDYRVAPLSTVESGHLEGDTTNEDDHRLTTNHDSQDDDEEPVVGDALENIETVIEPAVVQCVEDLHPDEGVEDQGWQLLPLVFAVVAEDRLAGKVEDKGDDQLVNCLTDDHLPHPQGDERSRLRVRLPVKKAACWGIGCEGQCGERVHDEVDPEQLNSSQHRGLVVARYGRDKGKQDGGDVDSNLELQELLDSVVYRASPE